jgi:peptidoglycan-N-acetylglucosamine deacetylase
LVAVLNTAFVNGLEGNNINSIWTRKISWRWPAGILGVLILMTVVLWLLGLQSPLPRFRLDPEHSGRIVPVEWPWWRKAADLLHGRRYLMLTFDDGPADSTTNMRILRILDKHNAHAVFFAICQRADLSGRASVLQATVAKGHVVGNHSYTHPYMPELTPGRLREEVVNCTQRLEQITGHQVRWFRPPFGASSDRVKAELERDGMDNVMWVANSQDTWQKKPEQIEHWSTSSVSNCEILLMHSFATTADALDRTLTHLEQMGYRFVLAED